MAFPRYYGSLIDERPRLRLQGMKIYGLLLWDNFEIWVMWKTLFFLLDYFSSWTCAKMRFRVNMDSNHKSLMIFKKINSNSTTTSDVWSNDSLVHTYFRWFYPSCSCFTKHCIHTFENSRVFLQGRNNLTLMKNMIRLHCSLAYISRECSFSFIESTMKA